MKADKPWIFVEVCPQTKSHVVVLDYSLHVASLNIRIRICKLDGKKNILYPICVEIEICCMGRSQKNSHLQKLLGGLVEFVEDYTLETKDCFSILLSNAWLRTLTQEEVQFVCQLSKRNCFRFSEENSQP